MEHADRHRLARNLFEMDEWKLVAQILADYDRDVITRLRRGGQSGDELNIIENVRARFRLIADEIGLKDPFDV